MVGISYKHGIIFGILFSSIGTLVFEVDGNSSSLPDWIKNTAKWWSEDQISETEYVTSLQYLIDQGVIKVNTPINNVLATDVSIPVDKQASSFVVKVTSEHYELNENYYTFAQFFNQNDASGTPRGTLVGIPENPEFILGSLPSEDKKQLYEYIEKTLNPGS